MSDTIHLLMQKGIRFTHPESVEIGPEVDPERISGQGVVIYGGCRIFGQRISISEGVVLGEEAPVTLVDCQVGPYVTLKGGFFKKAVFLEGASMGSGAHVREGTILEEGARGAHAVGLKQTILFPYVTLGSLINFCDCLMAGGTGRKDHSEVGSSYIHFNFTPYQDKATPSLMGDVPRGVMLNQRPIFLGGQGGLVGPCRLAFGTVIAAGSICRKDVLQPNRLILQAAGKALNKAFRAGRPMRSGRILTNNIVYIANLMALSCWYRHVRSLCVSGPFSKALHEGLMEKVKMALQERIRRLQDYLMKTAEKKPHPPWEAVEEALEGLRAFKGAPERMEAFLEAFEASMRHHDRGYVAAIQGLSGKDTDTGTAWLQEIVSVTVERLRAVTAESP